MFSHNMFIGVFIAWVRCPSILFIFVLRRCDAFIISVIVVMRRSIIITEHFLWHLIAVGKISIHGQLLSSMWWALRLTFWVLFITACHGGRENATVETLYSTIYYSKYFIELHVDKSTQYVALWTHKRHPIPRPFGRAMECLLWVLQQKLIVL